MPEFIDVKKLTDEDEIIKALEFNSSLSATIKNKILEIKRLEDINKSMVFKKEESILFEEENEKEEDDDLEYLYYYEQIKDADNTLTDVELTKLIYESLPSKSNKNYFNLINRMKIEILKEINSLTEIKESSLDDEDLLSESEKLIEFEKKKFKIIENVGNINSNTEIITNNKLYFLNTSSGNVYAISDLNKINKEYYESFKELLSSIKDGTFKCARRLTTTNNKINSISEVKGFKTRVIFDRIGNDSYIILMCAVKKCDFDNGYKKALEGRVLTYRIMQDKILSKKDDEETKKENEEIEKTLFLKLEGGR